MTKATFFKFESNLFTKITKSSILVFMLIFGMTSLRLNAECTSNALQSISADVVDISPCGLYFSASLNSGYTAQNYLWDFGDGSFSNLTDPTYLYSDLGPFTVTLTIVDQNGCLSTKSIVVYPGDISPSGQAIDCDGGFCNVFNNDNCTIDICAQEWIDHTWDVNIYAGTNINNSPIQNIPYSGGSNAIINYGFMLPGIYTVVLTYYDQSGNVSGVYTRQIEMSVYDCVQEKDNCSYSLCQTEYYGHYGCTAGVKYKFLNTFYYYKFQQPVSNTTYGIPFLNYELNQMVNNLNSQFGCNIGYANYSSLRTCYKGIGITFGHFFINSPIEFVSFIAAPDGDKCQAGAPQNPNAGLPESDIMTKHCPK